jgi:hypothetical protein
LIFPKGWFEQHRLTQDDLMVEANYLQAAGLTLIFVEET